FGLGSCVFFDIFFGLGFCAFVSLVFCFLFFIGLCVFFLFDQTFRLTNVSHFISLFVLTSETTEKYISLGGIKRQITILSVVRWISLAQAFCSSQSLHSNSLSANSTITID